MLGFGCGSAEVVMNIGKAVIMGVSKQYRKAANLCTMEFLTESSNDFLPVPQASLPLHLYLSKYLISNPKRQPLFGV